MVEKKAKKAGRIEMTPQLKRELKQYVKGKEEHEYLFRVVKVLINPSVVV